jgi:DNA-binding CsgD family transcriptional regulator
MFNASVCHLAHYDFQEQRLTFSVHTGLEHLSAAQWELYEALLPEDPRMAAYEKYMGKPQSCRMTVDEEVLHKSRFYRELLVPARIEYSLGVMLDNDGNSGTGLAICRDKQSSPFDQDDCDLLGNIIPHLKRALDMHKRFALLDFGQRTAFEALDGIATGIVLLDQDGAVKFANQLAHDIAADSDGIRLETDSVTFENQRVHSAIFTSVRESIASARDGRVLSGQAFSIPRLSGAAPYALMVSTLWGNHLRFDLGLLDDPVAVLFLSDPGRRQEAPAELLQRLFGLTPAESRVLENLVAGHSLKATAGILGVSQNTARHHLKAIFDKTGTSRQVNVVKLVMSTPLWIDYSRLEASDTMNQRQAQNERVTTSAR